MLQTHHRTCTLCEAMCGVVIETETAADGPAQVLSIKGDRADPFSRGHVCAKVIGLKTVHEDPDRLRQPMRRTAAGWESISWDDAFEAVEAGIRGVWAAHGRDAVALYAGNPSTHSMGVALTLPLLMASLDTRARFSATSADQLPHMLASLLMFGHQGLLPVPDLDRTRFLLMFGANPAASNGSLMSAGDPMSRIKGIVARGGRVLIFDPRRTETAHEVGEHHFIRPGADVWVLAALVQTLLAEQRVDLTALRRHVRGADGLASAVADFTPERVAELSGVPAELIRVTAREFAKAGPAVCYGRIGVCTQAYGGLAAWLINVLNIITGNLDHPGGAMFPHPALDVVGLTSGIAALRGSFDRYRSRVSQLPEFGGELPVAVMAEEMLTPGPGQIRALITHAGNPVLSAPQGKQLENALASLDFMVSIDFYLNETTAHAHIILPPVGPLERSHYDVLFNMLAVRNVAKYSAVTIAPPAGSRQDWEILIELAGRLGIDRPLQRRVWRQVQRRVTRWQPEGLLDALLRIGPYGSPHALVGRAVSLAPRAWVAMLRLNPLLRPFAQRPENMLSASPAGAHAAGLSLKKLKAMPSGMDLGPLKPNLARRIGTRDGRIHLLPEVYLNDLARAREALNHRHDPAADTLLLIGRRHVRSNNSWLHNSLPLVKGKPRCTAQMHPHDAARLNISEATTVRVQSTAGAIDLEVEITLDIMPGVISIPHGWGHHRLGTGQSVASAHAGVSANDITLADRVDPLSGNAAFNGTPVVVRALHSRLPQIKTTQHAEPTA